MVTVHYRRSPLGGLEIPIELTVKKEYTEKNKRCVEQYEALIREKYKLPIDGRFEASILDGLKKHEDEESSDDSELELEQC